MKIYFKMSVILITIYLGNINNLSSGDLYQKYLKGHVNLSKPLVIPDSSQKGNILFSQPTSVDADSNGNIYVMDSGDYNIKKFDSNGKYIMSFGRKGQGPGEFAGLCLMRINYKNIYTYDMANRRISIFTLKGELKNNYKIPYPIFDFKVDKLGNIILETRELNYEGTGSDLVSIILFNNSLKLIDTVFSKIISINKYIYKPKFMNIPMPFPFQVCWDINTKDNIIVGFSEKYKVYIYDLQQKEIKTFLSHHSPQVKVTKQDKEEFFKGIGHVSQGNIYNDKDHLNFIEKNVKFPAKNPFFRSLITDGEDNTLILLYEPPENGWYFYDVFNSEAKFINRVKLPLFLGELFRFKGRHIYGIEQDKEGFPIVVRYSIE